MYILTDAELTELNKRLLDCYMLGVLAVKESNYPYLGYEQTAITIQKNTDSEKVIFYVKPLSPEPFRIKDLMEDDETINLYIGFDVHSIPFLDVSYKYTPLSERVKKLEQLLSGKLLVFTPHIRWLNKGTRYARNLILHKAEDVGIDIEQQYDKLFYVPIPSPQQGTDFENDLKNTKEVLFPYYNNEMNDPELVLSNKTLYYFEDGLQKVESTTSLKKCNDPLLIRKYEIKKTLYSKIVSKPNENIIFVSQSDADTLKDEIRKSGISIDGDLVDTVISDYEKEYLFLEMLESNAYENKLYFDKIDIYNFHVSIKTSTLTVLSGQPGIGKSKISVAYARALGLKNYNNIMVDNNREPAYLIVPISPSYQSPEDITGYLNAATGIYTPSETGLIDFLINASKDENRKNIYIIIFEEMNLARIEHFFAPFISLLEMDEEDRKLVLYNKNSICHNREKYPPLIPITDNITFVATINIDSSTQETSERLLDRANVITLNKLPLSEIKKVIEDKGDDVIQKRKQPFQTEDFMRWRNKPDNVFKQFTIAETSFFDKLHNIIRKVDTQKGVSFRTIKNIGLFLNNIPEKDGVPLLSREDVIDLQVKQRILTKLRGHEEQYGELIGSYCKHEKTVKNSLVYDLISAEESLKISHFTSSKEEIRRKAKEMTVNGYCI